MSEKQALQPDQQQHSEPISRVSTASSSASSTSSSDSEIPAPVVSTGRRPSVLGKTPTHHEEYEYTEEGLAQLVKSLSRRITTVPSDFLEVTDPQWSLKKHLQVFLQKAQQQGLPDASSQSSIMWQNVVVRGAGSGAAFQDTVGGLFRAPVEAIKNFRQKEPEKTILHNVEGVVRSGEMLLVLGKPGAGCTTMLKNLAGLRDGFKSWDGDIKYNGVDVDVIAKRFRGDVAYNGEVDIHFPHLTVRQTLDFAAATRAPHQRLEGYSRKNYVTTMRDVLASTMGLRHTYNTKVGDDFVRGVSGGERKRVSIAEMMATNASVAFWDNSTRGLDASTSLEFAKALRVATNLTGITCIVAIYQAGENLTNLFDKVTVLYSGRQIFFGKQEDAKEFFINMGFVCPPRQTTADFLTAITDPNGRIVAKGMENKAPRNPDDFVTLWRNSRYYQELQGEINAYKNEFGLAEDAPRGSVVEANLGRYKALQDKNKHDRTREKSAYNLNLRMQFTETAKRAYQRTWGDKAFLFAGVFAAIFISLINGSVFYNTTPGTAGFFSKGGVIFFSILFNALQTLGEIATLYSQRPIIAKQKTFAMYHPSVDSLAALVADYPVKLMTTLAFDIIIYFMTNLKREPGAFFIFVLFTYVSTLAMSGIFRTIGAATKEASTALSIAGVAILAIAVYTGYVIPRPSMHPWFKWLSYINPISYAFEALMANEFHNSLAPCSPMSIVPNIPGANAANQVCGVTGAQTGNLTVLGDDYLALSFDYHYSNLWRNFGIVVAFWIFFVFTYCVAVELKKPAGSRGEYLIFRRGHAPKVVLDALKQGQAVEDVEGAGGEQEIFVAQTNEHEEEMTRRTTTALTGLAKSRDIFTWQHVNYDIEIKGEKRRLLADVQGYVKPGTLTALMGESGAGKTTLLNVLAQRVNMGVVSGDILVNGSALDHSFQRRTGYVQQQDVHLAEATVREALRFSAALRQPKEVSIEEKYEYVERVIEMLGMQEYAEAIIGVPGSGLNVEQRKRTTIGVELVAKPALLLFLDEPTSGLDSQSAWSIIKFLRTLASSGQAILCTIHQPSSELFEQFDRLLLLRKGGQTVYFGDIGPNSSTMIDYFERNGAAKCPDTANPAEYILDVIGAGATAKADRDWHEIWQTQPQFREAEQEIQDLQDEYSSQAVEPSQRTKRDTADFAMSWIYQLKMVTIRIFQHYWRSPVYIMGKAVLNIFAGLFLGFTFYKEPTSVIGLQNKLFAIFMATILSNPLMGQIQPVFVALRDIYETREKPSKMYHWTIFVLANIFAEIPYNIVCGTLFFLPWYFAVGFWKGVDNANNRGAYMWYMYALFQVYWSTFGQALAAVSPNAETAAVLTTLFFTFVVIFNGTLQPLALLPGFWHWMYYLSPFTWLISGMLSNALHDIPVNCSPAEVNVFQPPEGSTCSAYAGEWLSQSFGYLLNPNATADCKYCRYETGDQYLMTVNMSWNDRWRNTGLMWAYILFNVAIVIGGFYLARVMIWKLPTFGQGKKKPASSEAPNEGGAAERQRSSEAATTASEHGLGGLSKETSDHSPV